MIRSTIALIFTALLSVNAAAQAQPRTIEMQVNGLVCAFCAQGIAKKLGRMEATEDVLVNLENGLVAVALKPGKELDDATLRETLTDAGYSVQAIHRSTDSLDTVRARLQAKP
jgi:copper chaperone CopZ